MATIRTGIELQDNFTGILYQVINSVNMGLAAMEDLQQTMNAPVDMASIEAARDSINQATAAVRQLDEAMQQVETPAMNTPTAPASSAPVNIPIHPVVSDPLIDNPPPVEAPVESPAEPVQIPVQWQSDNMEVFTSTGVERFEQEVQSANNMLNTLNETQSRIAATAAQTNLFPANAVSDISNMQNRLSAIQQRIQTIENNPLNMGTDTANAELEQLRGQLDQAVQAQEMLNAAVENMDVQAANEAYLRLSQTVGNTERYIRDNVDEQGRFNREIQEGDDYAGQLKGMIASAVGAFAGVAGIKKAFSFVQDCTEAFNTQLNAETQLISVLANMLDEDYVAQFELETTADTTGAINEINAIQNSVDEVVVPVSAESRALVAAFDQITEKASEIQSRGIYGDEAMIAGAAEFSTYFTDTDAITMMMDTLADYAMGMSGGGEIDSQEMVDYATNLGKIMSGAYDAMTKKGFELTDAQKAIIEDTATQEQIVATLGEEYANMSSDMQAAAAISQVIEESWAGLYESMSNTPQGKIIQLTNAWGDMKEVIGEQLYPYVLLFVNAINENWSTIETVIQGITTGLEYLLGVLSWLMEGAINFAQVVMDNWSWISPIIYGIIGALAVYGAYLAITKGIELAKVAVKGIMAVAEGIHAAAIWATTSATWAEVTAQNGLNSAMYACPIVWIIILIIALIAIIYAVCAAIAKATHIANSGFGVICGSVNVVIQSFKNLGLSIANIALGIWNALGAVCDNMVTAFQNAINAVQSFFYKLLSTVLMVVSKIAGALNKLPFVEFDYSGLTSAADEYAAKAAGNKQDYTSVSDAYNAGSDTFDTFQEGWASEAFEAGASWGDGVAEKIGDVFSPSNLFNTSDIPDASNYSATAAVSDISSGVDDIAGSTADIADSMDITKEDLKYLRDIAERDVVNRFTTASIKVSMTNNNTVNNDLDLDGITEHLRTAVEEQMNAAAEGVH